MQCGKLHFTVNIILDEKSPKIDQLNKNQQALGNCIKKPFTYSPKSSLMFGCLLIDLHKLIFHSHSLCSLCYPFDAMDCLPNNINQCYSSRKCAALSITKIQPNYPKLFEKRRSMYACLYLYAKNQFARGVCLNQTINMYVVIIYKRKMGKN